MHTVIITNAGSECNCGWQVITVLDSEKWNEANKHARANKPSVIKDIRSFEERSDKTKRVLPIGMIKNHYKPFT